MKLPEYSLAGFYLGIFTVFLGVGFSLVFYAPTLVELCREYASHPGNIIGLIILFSTGTAVLKLLLSIRKTQIKLTSLGKSPKKLPKKLHRVLKKHTLNKSLFVVKKSNKSLAMSVGFWNSRILVTTRLINQLTTKELEGVVLHEWAHVKRKHGLLLLLGRLATNMLFFIPSMIDLHQKIRQYIESVADQEAIAAQNTSAHIQVALSKVLRPPTALYLYPQFRQNYHKSSRKIKIVRLAVSLASISFLWLTLSSQYQARALEYPPNSQTNQCAELQLSPAVLYSVFATSSQVPQSAR